VASPASVIAAHQELPKANPIREGNERSERGHSIRPLMETKFEAGKSLLGHAVRLLKAVRNSFQCCGQFH